MLALSVALLVVAADVGIRVEEAEGLDAETVRTLANGIAEAIHAQNGLTCLVVGAEHLACAPEDRHECIEDAALATGAKELVLLKVFAGDVQMRVVAERVRLNGTKVAKTEVGFRRADTWATVFETIAKSLYAEAPVEHVQAHIRATSTATSARTAPKTRHASAVPWIITGAGVAIAASGAFVLLRGPTGADRLDASPASGDQLSLRLHQPTTGLVPFVLLGAAAATIVTGLVLGLGD